MKHVLCAALLLLPMAVAAKPLPAADQGEVRCVAALALLANDQQRGSAGWDGFPEVTGRADHFRKVVATRQFKRHKMGEAAYRRAVIDAVAALQAESIRSSEPQALTRSIIGQCLALADKIDPPVPEPGLPRCTGLAATAYQDLRTREGRQDEATAMAVLAAVLEAEARKELRAASKSETEADIALGLEREAVAATDPGDEEAVYRNGDGLRQCMALVRRPEAQAPAH